MWPVTNITYQGVNESTLSVGLGFDLHRLPGVNRSERSFSTTNWSPDTVSHQPGSGGGTPRLAPGGIIKALDRVSAAKLVCYVNKGFLPIWNGAVYKIMEKTPSSSNLLLKTPLSLLSGGAHSDELFSGAFASIRFVSFYSEPFHRGTR